MSGGEVQQEQRGWFATGGWSCATVQRTSTDGCGRKQAWEGCVGAWKGSSEVYEGRGRRNLMARGQWSPYPLSWSQCHESWTWIGLSDE